MTTIEVGTALPVYRVDSVRGDDIKLIALILRDPNPIHFDLDAVAKAGLGDRAVNQGGATLAYVMNMLISWSGSRAALRSITTAFRANVFAGDDVVVGGVVTAVQSHEGGRNLVSCDVWVDVVDGPRAITGTATVVMGEAGA